jgi:hypothetical protein
MAGLLTSQEEIYFADYLVCWNRYLSLRNTPVSTLHLLCRPYVYTDHHSMGSMQINI